MMRLLNYLSITVLILAMLVLGSRVIGTQRPSAVEQFASQKCSPRPCWRDIHPGETSMDQARTILKADAISGIPDQYQVCYESNGCWSLILHSFSADPQSPVGELAFQPSPGAFLLGDAINLYGDPISSQLCYLAAPTNGDLGPEIQRPLMVGYLTFRGNIHAVVYAPKDTLQQRFDPAMDIYRLYYRAGNYDIFSPPWRGFSRPKKLGCNMG
jgi:hypothetical protein